MDHYANRQALMYCIHQCFPPQGTTKTIFRYPTIPLSVWTGGSHRNGNCNRKPNRSSHGTR